MSNWLTFKVPWSERKHVTMFQRLCSSQRLNLIIFIHIQSTICFLKEKGRFSRDVWLTFTCVYIHTFKMFHQISLTVITRTSSSHVNTNLVTMMYNLLVHDIIPLLFGKIVQKDWCSRLVEAWIIDLSLWILTGTCRNPEDPVFFPFCYSY